MFWKGLYLFFIENRIVLWGERRGGEVRGRVGKDFYYFISLIM